MANAACDPWAAATPITGQLPETTRRLRIKPPEKIIAVATHLDEELCAAGGLLAAMAEAGVIVHVLAVTDDDGTATLSAPALAVNSANDLTAAMSELVGFTDPADLSVVTPWERDSHPDHDLVGGVARRVTSAYQVRLLSYLIAGWRATSPTALPQSSVRYFALPIALRKRKDQALRHLAPPAPAAPHDPGQQGPTHPLALDHCGPQAARGTQHGGSERDYSSHGLR
jgi:LmbE family N-acetylglucosaminyl deacetylase